MSDEALRALRWVGIAAMLLGFGSFLIHLPAAEVIGPWLFWGGFATTITAEIVRGERHRKRRQAGTDSRR